MKTAARLITKNRRVFLRVIFDKLNKQGLLRWLSDKSFLKMDYWLRFGKKLNLKNPKTFNEKLQWLKLYDRRPEYVTMVDKIAVKDYVAKRIGSEFIIPTLGVWDKPEDIDWNSLPNQFVLKWNHDSGSIVICKDKDSFDKEAAIKKLSYGAKVNGFWYGREWPYKGVKPKLLAEKYMEDCSTCELRDYKVFTFDGKAQLLLVASERQKPREEVKFDYFDIEKGHLSIVNNHPNATVPPKVPEHFDEMIALAEQISAGYPHLRVDFYEVNGKIYFGEITLYHGSGLMTFKPDEWNEKMGAMIHLPKDEEDNNGGGNLPASDDIDEHKKENQDLVDYKFMCFNGKVKCCFTCTGRYSVNGLKVTFYDNDWNIMPFERSHPRETIPIQKPFSFEAMKAAAETLSKGIPFARIDFYEINHRPFFGEITLYPGSGHEAFQPEEWDFKLGSWINLPAF